MARFRVPGISVAVVADGRLASARGWGVREAGQGDPVTEDTVFQAGSISKPVAALCALRLVADGRLELDADVNDVLISWKVPPNGGWQPRVTVRQLLSHTAGLTVHGFPGYGRDERVPTLIDVLDGRGNTLPIRVSTMPGLQFSYSGGGYCVLQQLLVDLTGKSFPALAAELVLAPVGMHTSTYEQPLPQPKWARAASGHREGGKPVAGAWHVYPEMAAAGLWTTPSDLARFVIAIQRASAGAPDSILPRELADELLTPHAPNVPMGLGLLVEGEAGGLRFFHSGDDQGFVARMEGYAEAGLGAVAMSNSDSGWKLIQALFDAVARAYAWPDYLPQEPTVATVSAGDLEACAGRYASLDGRPVRIERRDDRLALTVPGQSPVELLPTSDGEWFAPALSLSVAFARESDGRVNAATVRQEAEYVQDLDLFRIE